MIPHARWIKGWIRKLKEAGCTISGNFGLLLLECHKDTHEFCSGDGISRPMANGFYVSCKVR